ncbi:MAG: phytoene/squalene synthase family protein [Solirubrobacterales bacterium]|nr:phytoene/squalene synthase family protein [Solirubrobacterales bacterium]
MLLQRSEDLVLAEARDTTNRVARTFSLACRLLPRDVRDDVYRLYLVFRTLDDLVDDGDPRAAARLAQVQVWCRTGATQSREAHVLADLATRHPIPRDALLDFCAGMWFDLDGGRCTTEEDLDLYCYRVAGTVGIVMASVLGFDGDEAEVRRTAAALGMAMQRTNVLRDIDEDGDAGRMYLAAETVARFGGCAPGRREALLRDQIARADALYDQGLAGVRHLRRGRVAIRAAASMYREILRQIERDGYGSRAGRAVVPARRKLLAVARAGV